MVMNFTIGAENWRPRSAHSVPLTDLELAKLGLLAQLEAQCRATLAMALKALEGLDVNGWRKLESIQFKQLVGRLEKAAAIDDALSGFVGAVKSLHPEILSLRHQSLHSMWGKNDEVAEGVTAWDLRRDQKFTTTKLDGDLQQLSVLTHNCMDCLMRVAKLILDGVVAEGTGDKGPRVRAADRWVVL